jgi:hypothetical protein
MLLAVCILAFAVCLRVFLVMFPFLHSFWFFPFWTLSEAAVIIWFRLYVFDPVVIGRKEALKMNRDGWPHPPFPPTK